MVAPLVSYEQLVEEDSWRRVQRYRRAGYAEERGTNRGRIRAQNLKERPNYRAPNVGMRVRMH